MLNMQVKKFPTKQEAENKTMRKNVIFNTLSHLIYMFALWTMTMITPRIGSSADAGIFTIVLSVSNICTAISTFAIQAYISSDIKRKFSDSQYLYFCLTSTAIAFVVALILCFSFGYYTSELIWTVLIYCIFTFTDNITSIMNASMIRIKKNYYFGYALIIKSIVILSLFVIGLLTTKNLTITFAIMACFSILYLVFVSYPLLKIHTKEKFSITKVMYKAALTLFFLALPIFINRLVFSTISSFPRLVLEQYYSKELVGYFGTMASISTVIQSAVAPIFSQFSPKFALNYNNHQKRSFFVLMAQIFAFIFAMTFIAFVCSLFLDKWLLGLLYPKDKEILDYAYYFKYIILLNGLQATVTLLAACIISIRKLKFLAISSSIGLILMFAFVYILIPRFAITGILICELICYAILMISFLVYIVLSFRKKSKKKF